MEKWISKPAVKTINKSDKSPVSRVCSVAQTALHSKKKNMNTCMRGNLSVLQNVTALLPAPGEHSGVDERAGTCQV